MGAHTGEPSRTDEGYVGIGRPTRPRASARAAHGGQILLSERTASLAREELEADGVDLRDLGEHALKDMAGPQHLFQVVIPELPSDFSALAHAPDATQQPSDGRRPRSSGAPRRSRACATCC